jgi:hypothetical protein
LNKKVWEAGVKGVPYRLRVRISRKRNDEEVGAGDIPFPISDYFMMFSRDDILSWNKPNMEQLLTLSLT